MKLIINGELYRKYKIFTEFNVFSGETGGSKFCRRVMVCYRTCEMNCRGCVYCPDPYIYRNSNVFFTCDMWEMYEGMIY